MTLPMRRRLPACLSLVTLCLVLVVACNPEPEPRRPNLVMIISDDQGWRDYGFMGSETVETPNLDRLASEGTLFRHGYLTSSICAPSLQSILTGLETFDLKHRLLTLRLRGIEPEPRTTLRHFSTLPRLLGSRGYASFQAGKIVERDYEVAGFRDGITPPGSSEEGWGAGKRIGRQTMQPVFDFIDAHEDRPFFLWFAPLLPHVPHDAPARYRKPFVDRGFSQGAVAYYANILRFDEVVGQLIEHLDARGLRDDTLIVFLADNGWDQEPVGPHIRTNPLTSAALGGGRGKKTMYELGFRTPMIFSWPGHVAEGVVRDDLVSSIDLFPTLLEAADVPAMPDRSGRSLLPALLDGEAFGRNVIVGSMVHARPNALRPAGRGPANIANPEFAYFLRTPEWHYIWYRDWDADELFNIHEDPLEEENRASRHPRLVEEFRRQIDDWVEEVQGRGAGQPPG